MSNHGFTTAKPVGFSNIIASTAGTPYLDITGAGFLIGIKNPSGNIRVEIDGVPILPTDVTKTVQMAYNYQAMFPFMYRFNSRLKVSTTSSTVINIQYTLD